MPTKTNVLEPSDFVHLHNHTQYSLLDGMTKVPALLRFIQDSGMEAVAITDHGTLSGAIEFYEESLKHEVKPIIGIETYIAARSHIEKDVAYDKQNYHLTVLAMNNDGYQNLMELSTIANLEGMYYRPRIDHQLLEKYNEGLIVLSGCIGGEVSDNLRQGQYDKAKEIAAWYKSVFGDRYYIELIDHGHKNHPAAWDEQIVINEQLMKLAKELKIPCVVTCDAHYLHHADREAHEILLCVQTGSFIKDKDRMTLENFELHVAKAEDIIERWGDEHPDFITNTKQIADRCSVTIDLGNILIPKFPVPKGETEKSFLVKQVYRGLAQRYLSLTVKKTDSMALTEIQKKLPKEVTERAKYELEIINQMQFNGYFLIIADFIVWGKSKGIVFGPGRGSAAGSIIAYALKITELDPLLYDLLFERFLNPDRISMPDIDIDIQDTRRNEVIEYCIDKYGTERVANIVTFGRMAARNAVRDVARVLQVAYSEADHLAKMIPMPVQGRHIPLSKSIKEDLALKNEYDNNPTARAVFDLAVQLEGTIRSHGVHAAGVVIAPDDIVKFAPLEMAQKGVVATQYSMGPIEELGLLKIDFLGLSNLTTINNALRIIKKVYGVAIDVSSIPLDDKKTFELFAKGNTTGVFQFESSGMKRYLKDLKPTVFEDIIAMNALYRPGPLVAGSIPRFIARKNGSEETSYDHESMKNALESTYGMIVYQEQVMQIAKDMCGFTGGEADSLRKAVGKKIRSMMVKMKDKIIDGATKNGVDKKIAEKFWNDVEGFSDYAFNKSHAACYGLIAYQTAYLKANYPEAYMAALMTSDYNDTDRLTIEITECQHMGIDVLPPDVQKSFLEFAVVTGKKPQISFGLAAIKNVGSSAVEEILRGREITGKFDDLVDFLTKVSPRVVNRKSLESLIKAGALDSLGDRATLLHNIDSLTAYSSRVNKEQNSGQTDLFGDEETATNPTLNLVKANTSIDKREQLVWERELLGIYLSEHPLAMYKDVLEANTKPIKQVKANHGNKKFMIGGVIVNSRVIVAKNGKKMAFVQIEDYDDNVELVIFPTIYEKEPSLWERDKVVIVEGKVSSRDNNGRESSDVKVIAESGKELLLDELSNYSTLPERGEVTAEVEAVPSASDAEIDDQPTAKPSRLFIKIESSEDNEALLSIKNILDDSKGDTEVVLVLGPNKQTIKLPIKIETAQTMLDKLKMIVGSENVKITATK
jgi:DNA polymerase III subunit alpha